MSDGYIEEMWETLIALATAAAKPPTGPQWIDPRNQACPPRPARDLVAA
jgi:hypothetical protein